MVKTSGFPFLYLRVSNYIYLFLSFSPSFFLVSFSVDGLIVFCTSITLTIAISILCLELMADSTKHGSSYERF